MINKKDKPLKASQAAKIIEVSQQVMFRMLHTGKIRGIKVGGLWRIEKKEIERFLREGNAPVGVDFLEQEENDA